MYFITTESNPTAALKSGEFVVTKTLPNLPYGLRKLLKVEIPRWKIYNLEDLYVAYPTHYGNANVAFEDGCIYVLHESDFHVINDMQHNGVVDILVESLDALNFITLGDPL